MENNTYIDKVLSHIAGKERKKQIEYELSDHMAEKEKWYTELEYDPETAAARAEADMGDPDTAGEELAAIHSGRDKKSRIIIALMLFLPLTAYLFVLLNSGGTPGYEGFESFDLYDLVRGYLACFMIAVMIYSFKKQRITPLIFSSAISAVILHYEKFCALFLTTGKDIGRYVFATYDFKEWRGDYISAAISATLSCNSVSEPLFKTVRVILPLIIIVCALSSVVIIIKNRSMKNRKHDYYIARGLRVFLSVFAVIILVSSAVQSVSLCGFAKSFTDNVEKIIPAENRKLTEKIYEFKETGEIDLSDTVTELSLENNPYVCTEVITEGCAENDFLIQTRTPYYFNLLNECNFAPFEKEAADSMIEFVRGGGKYIEDAPMCCELTFDGRDRIVLSCYTDYYGMNRLAFDYIDGHFQLVDTQLCTKPDIELSDEQLKQFYDAYGANRTDISEHLSIIKDPRYKFHVFSRTVSVTYNDIDDEYTVYFEYSPNGLTETDGKLYVDRDLIMPQYNTISFKFADEKVIILNKEELINETDYEKFEENVNKKVKQKKMISSWSLIDAGYAELDGIKLKKSERTDSVETFAERCFGVYLPLTGYIQYNTDGTYSFYDYSEDEMQYVKTIS